VKPRGINETNVHGFSAQGLLKLIVF